MAKDDDNAGQNLKQGLGLLWKAAKKAARDVKKDVTATTVSRTIGDAGREVARAATNVAEKVSSEIDKLRPKDPDYAGPDDERMKPPYEQHPPDAKPGDKPGEKGEAPAKPKGPTARDPGFRIAIDDAPKRKR